MLAHNISLISVQAGVALHLMDERPDEAAERARTALTAIRHASKEALGELRSVLGLLRASSGEAPTAVAGSGDGATQRPDLARYRRRTVRADRDHRSAAAAARRAPTSPRTGSCRRR